MAERRATNKYIPPDWDHKGSLNKYVGQHPLRERARKIDQGILIIRFELPFNIWCNGCGNHIGRGVRYNAEKKKIGNYYSTPILSFRMKCHLCDNWFEIHTDPKNAEYLVVSGARRKNEEWSAAENETIELKDEKESKRLEEDAFYRLEHSINDEAKSKESLPFLSRLQKANERDWADPYTCSKRLRKIFREEKKIIQAKNREAEKIQQKNSLAIPILPETALDELEAKSTQFHDHALDKINKRKREAAVSSLFDSNTRNESKEHQLELGSIAEQTMLQKKAAVSQLSELVTVNTRVKTDPFLKTNFKQRRTSQNQQVPNKNPLEGFTIKIKRKHADPE
ncbi:uncharacterized protein VTP21DRAFT_2369 [Calcarisporiella thermophila]|uniref:uncharacterized protein n=1 Tax=Calcarisporiella thermophila TaxID=911321 RepID=UPI00374230E2